MASDRGLTPTLQNSIRLVYKKEMRSHGSQVDVEVPGAPSYIVMPDETTFGSTVNMQNQKHNSNTTLAANTQTMYLHDKQID